MDGSPDPCPLTTASRYTNGVMAAVHPIRVRLWRGAWRPVTFIGHDLARSVPRVAFAEGAIIAQGAPAAVIGDAQVKRYILGEAPPLKRAAGASP